MMDEYQIRALLSAAATYDLQTGAYADIPAWLEAAERDSWTYGEALNAIHEHYADTRMLITPEDVTQRIGQKRHQRSRPRGTGGMERSHHPPASPQHRAACMTEIRHALSRKGDGDGAPGAPA